MMDANYFKFMKERKGYLHRGARHAGRIVRIIIQEAAPSLGTTLDSRHSHRMSEAVQVAPCRLLMAGLSSCACVFLKKVVPVC